MYTYFVTSVVLWLLGLGVFSGNSLVHSNGLGDLGNHDGEGTRSKQVKLEREDVQEAIRTKR